MKINYWRCPFKDYSNVKGEAEIFGCTHEDNKESMCIFVRRTDNKGIYGTTKAKCAYVQPADLEGS